MTGAPPPPNSPPPPTPPSGGTDAAPAAAVPDLPEGHSPMAAFRRRIRTGELGAWPVVIALVLIWVVFFALNSRFLSAQNMYNMAVQIAAVGVISVGIVLVLLLGEIDLSVGSVAGVGAAALAVLAVKHGVNEIIAVIVVVILGLLIGLLQGTIFAKVGVPAFVVTLAGNLGWLGFQLYLLSPEGTINFADGGFIEALTRNSLTPAIGWILGILAVAAYAAAVFVARRRRAGAGLANRTLTADLARIIGLGIIVAAAVAVLNAYRGVPIALVIFVGVVAVTDLVLRRTRPGRRVFAVGGNIEAARRAGFNVASVRIAVFMLASAFAAFGGVMLASRTGSASQSTGGGETLLIAIAAAVIGGVSLFGGRGSTYGALLGSIVLGSITSGLLLQSYDSSVRFMITAAVLLGAVILDSLSRRGRRSSGRA